MEETLTEEQPTAAGTEDTTESLIAEVQNNAPAAEEAASASGASRYTREENPLFSLLNPYDGGGAVVGSVAVADTATVAGYLRMDAVRELLPSDVVSSGVSRANRRTTGVSLFMRSRSARPTARLRWTAA